MSGGSRGVDNPVTKQEVACYWDGTSNHCSVTGRTWERTAESFIICPQGSDSIMNREVRSDLFGLLALT